MKKTLMAAVALLGGIAMAADSTYSFTYQAALRDEHGLVISNGTAVARNQTVTLRLWDAPSGGNVLWGRTYNVYTDETGLFNLEVTDGAGSRSDDAPANAALEKVFAENLAGGVYIGLFVKGSSGEIVPRQRLFAVPFAAVANDVRKISGNIEVGGKITMKDNAGKSVEISASGITQKGASSNDFQNVVADGTISAGGVITAGGGLAVNGGTVTIMAPTTISKTLTVAQKTTFSGGVEVSGGDLTVGGSEVVPVPVGGVIMWTKTTPPEGGSWSSYKSAHWAICNGQNNTPDLRGRFVVGVNNSTTGSGSGSAYYFKDTGGEATHKLSLSEMPKHDHSFTQYAEGYESARDGSLEEVVRWNSHSEHKSKKVWTTYAGGSNDLGEGESVAHENRPPYYALYYIMRIK